MLKAEKPVHIFIHLGVIGAIIFLIALLFFKVYLPVTTNHNERIVVPVLEGKSISEVQTVLEDAGLRFQINDSTYIEGKKAHHVLSQQPKAGSEVKTNRKIYLTVTSATPPKVKMPKLTDISIVSAELALKSYDLKLGKISYESNPYKDLVLAQTINGIDVVPGKYIPKGSRVDLIVGNGETKSGIEIPDLIGMPKDSAISKLKKMGLTPGIVGIDTESDQPAGIVTLQSPEPISGGENKIEKGQAIDIWVSQ